MKKILLLFTLFATVLIHAQNINYQAKLKEGVTSIEEVRKLTDPIVEFSEKPLRFYKSKEIFEKKTLVIQYLPSDISDDEWINDTERKLEDEAIVFYFDIWNKGEDLNLEVQGIKTYYFSAVRGKYLFLFPYWKEYFNRESDLVDLSKKGFQTKNDFSFSGSSGLWRIQ